MVYLFISVRAHPQKRNELLSACRLMTSQTRKEEGCISCRISQDIDDENRIYLEETWEERPLLDAYFRSDIFSALFGAVKLLGENHDFRINDGFESEGLEVFHKAHSTNDAGPQIVNT